MAKAKRVAQTTATFEVTLPLPQGMTLQDAQRMIRNAITSRNATDMFDGHTISEDRLRVKLARKTVFYP